MTSRSRLLGLVVVVLLAGALVLRSGALAWLAIPFMAYLGAGLALAPVAGGTRLAAGRSCREEPRADAVRMEMTATVRNLGPRAIGLRVADPPMPGARLVEGSLETRTTLRPGDAAELRYALEATRGRFAWDEARVGVSDPLGLFEVEARFPAPARVKVHPRFRRMRSIPLRLRETLSSLGSIPIRRGGDGTDFWGIREFRRGDPLKRLYWRLYARDPLRRYAKEFVQERTAEVVIVLDGRLRMELVSSGSSLFEREVEAAASLAAMLVRQGQRVGLYVMGPGQRAVQPDYGRPQLRRILDCLAESSPESEGSRDALRCLPALRYSRSAFMIFVSPIARDDEPAFLRLRQLGYKAVVVSADALDFAREDFVGGAARTPPAARRIAELSMRAGRIERRTYLDRISRLSFPVVEWHVDRDLAPLLDEALARAARARDRL